MKSKMMTVVSIMIFAMVLAAAPVATADITVPNGTLTASGEGGYDYSISSTSINAQMASEVHVIGKVTGYSLPNVNAGWFTIGLITKSERDRALVEYGVPSYMFNQAVFMMGMKGSAGNVVMPSDYAGDYPGGTGEEQTIGDSFTFDLKLVASGSAGGTAYLSIDGGAYGTGLTYGTDNWNNYGYSFPAEDLSESYLIVQLYTWDAGETYSVSFEDVSAIPAATVALVPNALHVAPGSTVTVSVNMTVSWPITMTAISTNILYDPNVFTYDANSGVVKGNLLTHIWDLGAGSPAEGKLRVGGIDLGLYYPDYFETLTAGSGKLFTFSLKAKENAPTGPSALTWGVYDGYDNATAGFDYGDKDFVDIILPESEMSGASINVCPAGDLDGDCDVDFNDLAILANNWLVGTE